MKEQTPSLKATPNPRVNFQVFFSTKNTSTPQTKTEPRFFGNHRGR